MDRNEFEEHCKLWRATAYELAEAHNNFRNIKHDLELAKATAWADGQVGGNNAEQRKASLYIIVEPYIETLIEAENAVMTKQIQERYLRNMVEYAIWNGISSPGSFGGIRELIDGQYAK